jgi:hypothetical protein
MPVDWRVKKMQDAIHAYSANGPLSIFGLIKSMTSLGLEGILQISSITVYLRKTGLNMRNFRLPYARRLRMLAVSVARPTRQSFQLLPEHRQNKLRG